MNVQANQQRPNRPNGVNGRAVPNRNVVNGNRNQPDAPVPRVVRAPEPLARGSEPTSLTFNNILGREAKENVLRQFGHLFKADPKTNKMYFNEKSTHPHPYSAWMRETADTIVEHGLVPLEEKLDIGAHLMRNLTKNKNYTVVNGVVVGEPWSNRTRSMCPALDAREELRQKQWRIKLAARTETTYGVATEETKTLGKITVPQGDQIMNLPNTCLTCVAGPRQTVTGAPPEDENTQCDGCSRPFKIVKAIDSAYFESVMQEVDYRCHAHHASAFVSFHDYDFAVSQGTLSGAGYDKESTWSYDPGTALVTSKVHGNPEAYKHKVLSTNGCQTWAWESVYDGYWLIFEKKQIFNNKSVPYVLCEVTMVEALSQNECPISVEKVFYKRQWYLQPKEKDPETYCIDVSPLYAAGERTANAVRDLIKQYMGDNMSTRTEKITVDRNYVYMERWRVTILGCKKNLGIVKAPIDLVSEFLTTTIGIVSTATSVQKMKAYYSRLDEELRDKNSPKYISDTSERFTALMDAQHTLVIADVIAANIVTNFAEHRTTSQSLMNMKDAMLGKVRGFTHEWNTTFLKTVAKSFMALGLITALFFIVNIMTRFVSSPGFNIGARADQGDVQVQENHYLFSFLVTALICYLYWPYATVRVPKQTRSFPSLCVRDPDRVDPIRMRGRVDPKFKVKGDWPKDLRHVECDAKTIEAKQIFAEFTYPGYSISTFIHACKRTKLAAMLRACSNKVSYDPVIMSDFSKWFRQVIIPEFMNGLAQEQLDITVDDWLKGFPQRYQETMNKEMQKENWAELRHYQYESFPKIEFLYTPTMEEDVCTKFNDVKERQISGPPNAKKILLNPIIKKLEAVAAKHVKGYCGGKNFTQLSEVLTEAYWKHHTHVWAAADGSGFDMTQLPLQNKLMNELIMKAIDHKNVTLYEPLSRATAAFILKDSINLDVSVDRGSVTYQAEGRASGDGWTTFGNTMLMLSYWRYTYYKAGISDRDFDLFVKGDDVLMILKKKCKAVLEHMVEQLFAKKQDFVCFGLGQICKFLKFGTIEEMDFLSCNFYMWRHYVLVTRIYSRIFQNLCVSLKVPPSANEETDYIFRLLLLKSKLLCLAAWGLHMPILRVLIPHGLEFVEREFQRLKWTDVKLKRFEHLTEFNEYSDGFRTYESSPDHFDAAMQYLLRRHDLSEAGVVEIEAGIKRQKSMFEQIHIPALANLFG